MSLLSGKKVVVMGVANKRSIAWGCAKALMEQGAEVIYTYQNERMKKQLEGFSLAQDISAYSFIATAKYAKPYLAENSGLVTMSYLGSQRAVPNYNMMGIAKAALEAEVRYLAAELSPQKIRVNGVSAGAIKTLAVTGVQDYQKLIQLSEDRTPDHVGVTIEEVGNAAAFLISPYSSGIIGEVIYVDKGVHLS